MSEAIVTMEEMAVTLARAREMQERAKAEVQNIKESIAKLLELTSFQHRLDMAQAKLDEANNMESMTKAMLGERMVAEYETTKERKFPFGQVKMFTVLDYKPEEAVAYAVQHQMTAWLKLNTAAFESAAKAKGADIECVKIGLEPRPAINTDLNEFLHPIPDSYESF